jgi:hypothetical protein
VAGRLTAAPPPRRRRPWVIVLVSVAVLTVAVCSFGLIRPFLGMKRVIDIDGDVNRATAAYLDDYRDGLSQAGYDGLCTETKEQFGAGDFRAPAGGDAIIGHRITSTDVDHDRGRATVGVEIRRADGATTQEVVVLDEEGEEWKVCPVPE